ncbi:hypothetical protein [Streptomyces sp. AD55]|uniref:hypothetical protein n=1 Tax=Streptomyces sp. AD55 TaxID=3242895 RepID=UPI003528D323
MSTSNLLLILLLVLVGFLAVGALGYVAYQHPALAPPLGVALAGAAVLVALVAIVVTVGHR